MNYTIPEDAVCWKCRAPIVDVDVNPDDPQEQMLYCPNVIDGIMDVASLCIDT